MEEQKRDAEQRTPEYSAPILPDTPDWAGDALAPQEPPFSASRTEKIAAFLMYPLAFCYIQALFAPLGYDALWFCVFCAGFLAMTEVLCRGRRRTWESWVWLACLLVLIGFRVRMIAEAARCGENAPVHAVGAELSFFLLHAYAVYWALCRSDTLLGGGSGHLLPLDALNGMIVFPFGHFFLRIRTAVYALTHLRRKTDEKRSAAMRAGIFAAVLAACVLLVLALRALSDADARFGEAVSGLLAALTPDWNNMTLVNFLFKLLLSLPVGAYLFGLLAGAARQEPQRLRARGSAFEASLQKLHKVPSGILIAAAAVFAAVYLAFFALQASYLFGAFTRTVPEGYTVAEYARQGFFSLCRVMAVNFALLWLMTRTSTQTVREQHVLRVLCTVLLAQSLLFAVVAASKLALYITSYGFTPLRLQSAWLITVLTAGCVCALYSLWSGKRSFRIWTLFSGVTLALLHLY